MFAVEHELRAGDPSSVALGRNYVTEILGADAGSALPPGVLDDVVLAASELVTNAVVAAEGRVCVAITVTDDHARVSVFDDGPGDPVARASTPDRVHGRGLSIVEIVAARWGVLPEPPGKWVWAEFPVALRAAAS